MAVVLGHCTIMFWGLIHNNQYIVINSLNVLLTQSYLSFRNKLGISLNCISMPFRLMTTKAPSTDYKGIRSKFGGWSTFTDRDDLYQGKIYNNFTFCSDSRRNPIAKVTIMTIIADKSPATCLYWYSINKYKCTLLTIASYYTVCLLSTCLLLHWNERKS